MEVESATIGAAVEELEGKFPGIKERLVDEAGEIRRFVNVYVNEEDIRFLENQDTPLKDGDDVNIIPAIAGVRASRWQPRRQPSQHVRPRRKQFAKPSALPPEKNRPAVVDVSAATHPKPVVWELSQKFPVITNVRQASVTGEIGLFALNWTAWPTT